MANAGRFARVLMIDWSAASKPSPRKPSADAIWIAETGAAPGLWYARTRAAAMQVIHARIAAAQQAGDRILCGFDFPFGYPAGFAQHVTGQADALTLWAHLAGLITDAPDNANNRFPVAADLNRLFPGIGPFWGCPSSFADPGLPPKGRARQGHGLPERRAVEDAVRRAQPCWKLFTTGSVGSQALLGIARLQALRQAFGDTLAVWPFQSPDRPVVLAEVYPSLLDPWVRRAAGAEIKDSLQVRLLAATLAGMDAESTLPGALAAASGPHLAEEAWILGVGAEPQVFAAADAALATLGPAPVPVVVE